MNPENKLPVEYYSETPTGHISPTTETPLVPESAPAPAKPQVKKTFAGGTWTALIVGALLLILLLIFIMQNQQSVTLEFFTWQFSVPAGVGTLLAAITGALIMALVGGVRIIQLRRQIRKA
ncbi:hypothetical membrane protein [Corynebacterium kutscheri]|uniref:Hypothetical membrane protein n=1 Tax=Corynebacterium kutscheri TaxID=35755 RepID=A0A0F6R020_9CORY|nr:putative integral membrane protein [Corynebacterium kutscheri]VEH08745.1 hypothetical membrane protein [Corynebacterium kutscheri]VEH09791.1 hypothetical membrane protein [Corynebacterium kutscheri]VEH79874.1 hypothetical membrane protein [Corynebacterium kutscheri]